MKERERVCAANGNVYNVKTAGDKLVRVALHMKRPGMGSNKNGNVKEQTAN